MSGDGLAAEASVTEPEPETPEPAITVTLANSRKIGGRSCQPGDTITMDASEARQLMAEGLATRT